MLVSGQTISHYGNIVITNITVQRFSAYLQCIQHDPQQIDTCVGDLEPLCLSCMRPLNKLDTASIDLGCGHQFHSQVSQKNWT